MKSYKKPEIVENGVLETVNLASGDEGKKCINTNAEYFFNCDWCKENNYYTYYVCKGISGGKLFAEA